MAALVLLSGIASALLVRYSPGAMVDERELDSRLSNESLAAIRASREAQSKIGPVLARYLRGDLGYSVSRNAPVGALIRQNAPSTLGAISAGLLGAWVLGLGIAIPVTRFRDAWWLGASAGAAAAVLLCLPAAYLAYLSVSAGMTAGVVLILVLAPRVFRFSRNLLQQAYGAPHVEVARARGVNEWRILSAHVLPAAGPQLLALGAASVSMAIGAAIPVEAICDSGGLGRLAWQAATARDLPLLVNLTMLIALATTAAMTLAEIAGGPREAGA